MSRSKHPLLLTVREVSLLLRIQRPKVYELIKAGAIAGFKLGADWRIKRGSIEELIGPIPEEFFERSKQAAGMSEEFEAEKERKAA